VRILRGVDVALMPLLMVWLSDWHGGGGACLGDAGVICIIEDMREGSMATSPYGGLDRSNHLGHLLYHFVHGFCGWLPNDDVKGFCHHDEAHRLMNG
jgi:hypothetical protein